MAQGNKSSLIKDIREFLLTRKQMELISKADDFEGLSPYYNLITGSGGLGFTRLREIPDMLQDPIISSALSLIMETAWQTNFEQEVFWVSSKVPVLERELRAFHEDSGFQSLVLTLAYNLLLWGNLPLKHNFDANQRLIGVTPIPDFTSVVPIILSNTLVGYQVDGEFRYPYEYTFAQLSYYRNLGGITRSLSPQLQTFGMEGDAFANEFVLAPSYLSAAAKPWRYLNLIEDSLLLSRLDQSNYYRIISVDVGTSPYSKSAVQLLNYYRNLFKKVRRVSYESSGMASTGKNQVFEVIVPKSGTNGVDVQDVGGSLEVKAVADLETQTQRLFSALRVQPSMIGYSADVPSSLGESPAVLWDKRFSMLCKTLVYSVFEALRHIDTVYLRSRGYDVGSRDWSYHTVGVSVLEDKERSELLKESVETFGLIADKFKAAEVSFDPNALARSILTSPLSGAGVSIDDILSDPDSSAESKEIVASASSLFMSTPFSPRQLRVLVSSGVISSAEAEPFLTSDSKSTLIASSRNLGATSFSALCSDLALVSDDMLVDVSERVLPVIGLDMDDIVSRLEVVPSQSFETIPLPDSVHVPAGVDLSVKAGEVYSTPAQILSRAVIVRNRLILLSREDVLGYLSSVASGQRSLVVSSLWDLDA